MKSLRYSLLALGLLAGLGLAADAQAEIGWAGMIWPNHGTMQVSNAPLTVYARVWKSGVTESPGQGAGIAATLHYKTDLVGTDTGVPMVYNTDIDVTDEHKGDVPQAALDGTAWVEIWIEVRDLTDNTTYTALGDQAGNGQPIRYNIAQALPNDVAVTFTLCMSGAFTAGEPCVTGSQAPIGNWGAGVSMTNVSGELWTVTVIFPAGSSPALEYKYRASGCTNWELDPNRSVTLPTDGTTAVTLPADSYNRAPMGCGLGAVLPNDVTVTFTLCMSGTPTSGAPCVIGNQAPIGNWSTGVSMTNVSGERWTVTATFPAGSNPAFEYKYKADGCTNWEADPNRSATLPTDGTTAVTLPADSYNRVPIGCGLGAVLSEEKVVCLQVCMAGAEAPPVCAIGSVSQLGNWVSGVATHLVGPALYQACISFPAGTAIPLNVEYKFKKDDCSAWEESIPNRAFTIDSASPREQAIMSSWDDGPSACAPVNTRHTSWGRLKSLYR